MRHATKARYEDMQGAERNLGTKSPKMQQSMRQARNIRKTRHLKHARRAAIKGMLFGISKTNILQKSHEKADVTKVR